MIHNPNLIIINAMLLQGTLQQTTAGKKVPQLLPAEP